MIYPKRFVQIIPNNLFYKEITTLRCTFLPLRVGTLSPSGPDLEPWDNDLYTKIRSVFERLKQKNTRLLPLIYECVLPSQNFWFVEFDISYRLYLESIYVNELYAIKKPGPITVF